MDSFVYLPVVYIRHSASIAPGARAFVCALPPLAARLIAAHVSGASHSKVYTLLQYEPQCVSHTVVLARMAPKVGW